MCQGDGGIYCVEAGSWRVPDQGLSEKPEPKPLKVLLEIRSKNATAPLYSLREIGEGPELRDFVLRKAFHAIRPNRPSHSESRGGYSRSREEEHCDQDV